MLIFYLILGALTASALGLALLQPDLFNLGLGLPQLGNEETQYIVIGAMALFWVITLVIQQVLNRASIEKLNRALARVNRGGTFSLPELENNETAQIIDELMGRLDRNIKKMQGTLETSNSDVEKAISFSEGLNVETGNQRNYLERIAMTLQAMTLSTDSIVAAVTEQNEIVQKTNQIFNGFNKSIQDLFTHLTMVNEKFISTLNLAQSGSETIRRSVDSLQKINDSAKEIEVISGFINDISDRTNLLSLNATIEAARAGKHGLGFAVVADEISKLADQSSQSVLKITELIEKNIQFSTLRNNIAIN